MNMKIINGKYPSISVALIIIFFIASSQCFAEKIYCKDGKILNEKINYRNRGIVWVQKSGGSVGINVDDIEKIENDDGSVSKYDYKAMGRAIQASLKGGKYSEAIWLCSKLLESVDSIQLHYLRGILSQKTGDLKKAEEDYAFLVKNKVADAAILNNLGTIYANDKKYQEAVDLFLKAVSENPDMVEVHDNLAAVSLQTKDYNRAMDEYERGLEREPANITALYNLGIIYMSKGDSKKAKELWEKALSVRPEDADTEKALEYLKAKNK